MTSRPPNRTCSDPFQPRLLPNSLHFVLSLYDQYLRQTQLMQLTSPVFFIRKCRFLPSQHQFPFLMTPFSFTSPLHLRYLSFRPLISLNHQNLFLTISTPFSNNTSSYSSQPMLPLQFQVRCLAMPVPMSKSTRVPSYFP